MIGFDKVMHLLLGAAVAMVAVALGAPHLWGFYAAVVIGALKECRDAQGFGNVEFLDFAATALGGLLVWQFWMVPVVQTLN